MIATQPVSHAPYQPVMNAHDAPTPVWGELETLLVYALAPSESQTLEGDREPATRRVEMYAPLGIPNAPGDRWVWQGQPYKQLGFAEDFSKGPFWPGAGLRIHLQETEG